MNIKGLKLNHKLIHSINNSIGAINDNNLHGIDCYNAFSWKGFTKEEFKNLLKLFVYLDYSNVFSIFSDDQIFIFNYSTDVTEIDIATVAEKDGRPIIIDIESKNGKDKDLEKKIKEQIRKRKDDHLPQLIKTNPFLTMGFVNEEFVCGYYFDGNSTSEITNLEGIELILKTFKEYRDVEDYLTQTSNLASIVKVCNDIKKGSYKFYEDTNRHYEKLIDKIGKENVSIVYGHAGTGKSVLALKLFFENTHTKILILNSKLYYALNFNKNYYYENRATFNTDIFLNIIDEKTISIIDECQRISIDTMAEIIKKSKITYLFGDNRQACFRGSTLLKSKELEKELKTKYGFIVSSKEIYKSRRYSDTVDKALGFLTGKDSDLKDVRLPADYQIKLFYDEHKFMEYYKSLNGIKKIYVPVNRACIKEMSIDNIVFKAANYDDDLFSIWKDSLNYYGTTYHALSFDIDHCFVYLDKIHMISLGKKQVMYYEPSCPKEKISKINLFLNELNVLFTRGRKSLNIYIKDIETYLYLNLLLSKIK